MKQTMPNEQLFKILKQDVTTYFEKTGKSRFADGLLWTKLIVFSLIAASGYILLLTEGQNSLLIVLAGYLIFSIGMALFVVTVAHDASHKALFKSKTANTFMSYSWNLLGISRELWEIKHHHSHHIYTNIPHEDVDIEESPLLRFSSSYTYRSHYKYQQFYAPFLYLMFGIFIVYARDFIMLFGKKLDGHSRSKLPRHFLLQLIATKLFFFTIAFVIPYLILPFAWWQILTFHFISLAIGGSLLLLVLVVPHLNEDAALHDANISIKDQNDWALHQIYSTVDSSPDNRLLNWLTGGLNTHLIHHLFPNICHVHYRDLTKIIKNRLQEKGIPYKEKTFSGTLAAHFKYLKLMGIKPEKYEDIKISNLAMGKAL